MKRNYSTISDLVYRKYVTHDIKSMIHTFILIVSKKERNIHITTDANIGK